MRYSPRSKPTLAEIANSYGMTRQNLHHIMRVNGFTRDDMQDPRGVFYKLLHRRSTKLRKRLLSNQACGHVLRKLNQAAA